MQDLALIIVTYKRSELLGTLLASVAQAGEKNVRWLIVVDNAAHEEGSARACVRSAFESGKIPAETELIYVPMAENTGGSGGFSAGVKLAYALGAKYFWLMDDDVAIVPDALDTLDAAFAQSGADAIQGARLDFDGGQFYWQYKFFKHMLIYNPLGKKLEAGTLADADVLCFEGSCFTRKLVETLGAPDPRFFIYWDDANYGLMARRAGLSVKALEEPVLKRTRNIANKEMGSVRQLNTTSNMTRYYITRNRGYMARYAKLKGEYNPLMFALGTAATFAKEFIRLMILDRSNLGPGMARLRKGQAEARRLLHDPSWKPQVAPPDPDDVPGFERIQ